MKNRQVLLVNAFEATFYAYFDHKISIEMNLEYYDCYSNQEMLSIRTNCEHLIIVQLIYWMLISERRICVH